MELQLGLALPCNNPIKGFDLNNNVYEPKEMVGSDMWNNVCCFISDDKKRSFDEAFEKVKPATKTLPLLLWNDKPNDKDDGDDPKKKSSYTVYQGDGEGDCIVGWPPIKSWRKKLHLHYQEGRVDYGNRREENGCGGSNSMHVKVKMEGVIIGRKVDLSLHQSYQTLTTTLIRMFGKYQKKVKGSKDDRAGYTLTYQDSEGDWLLVGDVPWEAFIQSVKRLKIQKCGS